MVIARNTPLRFFQACKVLEISQLFLLLTLLSVNINLAFCELINEKDEKTLACLKRMSK